MDISFIIGTALLLCILVLPIYFTVMNIQNLKREEKRKELLTDISTIVVGLLFSFIYMDIGKISDDDWYIPIYRHELHRIFHSENEITVTVILTLFFVSLLLLCILKADKLPPLVSVFIISLTLTGLIFGIIILIHLIDGIGLGITPLLLYYINLLLIAIRRIRFHIREHVFQISVRNTEFRNKIAKKLYEIMSDVSTMNLLCFIMVFPAAVILEIIFILIGQGPDGIIKAFTETADWTFSLQTPPPPKEYDGHYLCTVAAGGHKKVVRPLRYGKRLGKTIIVNRQLLTANAFEDLIQERLPRFHRFIRGVYNKYGYPISKHITTPLRADMVYILMKPFEALFLLTLYLFDTNPENRIAVQYSDYKHYKES